MALFGRKDPAAIPLKNEPYNTIALVLEDGDFSRWLDAMERLSALLEGPFNFGHEFRGGGLLSKGRAVQGPDALARIREKLDAKTDVLTLARTDPSYGQQGYDWVCRFYQVLATVDRNGLGEGSWRSILSLPEPLWEALGREPLLELASGGFQVVSGEIFRLPLGEGPLFCAVDPREDRAEFCQAYPGYALLEELSPDA